MLAVVTAVDVDVDVTDVDRSMVAARGWVEEWRIQSNMTVSRPVCGVHLMVEGQ